MSNTRRKQIPLPTGDMLRGSAGADAENFSLTDGQVPRAIGGAAVAGVDWAFQTNSNPTVNNDNVDTAGAGREFYIGDIWINNSTAPKSVFVNVNNATGAAEWVQVPNVTSPLFHAGVADADNTPTITGFASLADAAANAADGAVWVVTNTGGTNNFNGTWDASANAEFVGATFEVGDRVVKRGAALDKLDSTDPLSSQAVLKGFEEAGAVQAGNHILTGTLPASVQGGAAARPLVHINGVRIQQTNITVGGGGPFTITLDMASIGYPLDATDQIQVDYLDTVP